MSNRIIELISSYEDSVDVEGIDAYRVTNDYLPPVPEAEVAECFSGKIVPEILLEFWLSVGGARLYFRSGQQGLRLLGPRRSIEVSRNLFEQEIYGDDLLETDVVVGEFEVEPDKIVVVDDGLAGSILWANPIRARDDWDHLGGTFPEFLQNYRNYKYL